MKALFVDLDNTIYPVSAIHKESAAPLIRLIAGSVLLGPRLGEIEAMMQRKPCRHKRPGHADILPFLR